MIMSLHTKIKMKKEVSYWSEKLRVLHSSLLSQYLKILSLLRIKRTPLKMKICIFPANRFNGQCRM